MAALPLSTDAAVRALQDRADVTDVLYRYASAIDAFDSRRAARRAGRRPLGAVRQRRPGRRRRRGRALDRRGDRTVVWQHHLLSVYHVDVDGDDAKALVYHTSHQVFEDDPDTAKLIVGRYSCELRREPGGWRISRLVLEILWAEDKTDPTGYLALIGGRGPQG